MKRSGLIDAFEETWPPERVVVTCEECDEVLLNTEKSRPTNWSPIGLTELVCNFVKEHRSVRGHSSCEVGIVPEPIPLREIDCDITVKK
jgi:hypothetical protein